MMDSENIYISHLREHFLREVRKLKSQCVAKRKEPSKFKSEDDVANDSGLCAGMAAQRTPATVANADSNVGQDGDSRPILKEKGTQFDQTKKHKMTQHTEKREERKVKNLSEKEPKYCKCGKKRDNSLQLSLPEVLEAKVFSPILSKFMRLCLNDQHKHVVLCQDIERLPQKIVEACNFLESHSEKAVYIATNQVIKPLMDTIDLIYNSKRDDLMALIEDLKCLPIVIEELGDYLGCGEYNALLMDMIRIYFVAPLICKLRQKSLKNLREEIFLTNTFELMPFKIKELYETFY